MTETHKSDRVQRTYDIGARVARRLLRKGAPDYTAMTFERMKRFLYFDRMFEHVRRVDGDIVECGVGQGRSFLMFSVLMNVYGREGMLWGFDSFEGFPEPSTADESTRNVRKGELSNTTPELVKQRLISAGADEQFVRERTSLVPGYFEESLAAYRGAPIALLHVDVDLYESYRTVLETLYGFVAPGGAVLFDEYRDPLWPGAERAVDEFFGATARRIEWDELTGKHSLIKDG